MLIISTTPAITAPMIDKLLFIFFACRFFILRMRTPTHIKIGYKGTIFFAHTQANKHFFDNKAYFEATKKTPILLFFAKLFAHLKNLLYLCTRFCD